VRCRGAIVAAVLVPGLAAAAPRADHLFPPGGIPAATTTVVASGTFPVWPVGIWTDRGQLAIACTDTPGTFTVAVPADGAAGVHRLRFHDATGASAVRRFVVDSLPALPESEPNDAPRTAQAISLPVVVDGILDKPGQVDCFRVELTAGQRLVAAVDAHGRLSSPFDPGLDLLDERGALIERNLDAAGLDPRIVHVTKRAGPVVVRVFGLPATPDSTIGLAGGASFVYRLTLTDGPLLTGCVPGAIGATAALAPRGVDLAAVPVVLSTPGQAAVAGGGTVRTATLPGAAGLVEIPETTAAVVEAGPWPRATPLAALPACVTGCLETAGEARGVRFGAVKGKRLAIECAARSIGSAADPVVTIHDAAGRRLFVHDAADERFVWQPPADGDYQLAVADRRDGASPWHGFRVSIEPEAPAVRLSVATDAVTGTVGKPIAVEVAIDRRHGFATPLAIGCEPLAAGIEAAAVVSPAEGDAAKKVTLEIVCREPYSGPVRIVARAEGQPDSAPLATAACGPEHVIDLWVSATPAAPEGAAPR